MPITDLTGIATKGKYALVVSHPDTVVVGGSVTSPYAPSTEWATWHHSAGAVVRVPRVSFLGTRFGPCVGDGVSFSADLHGRADDWLLTCVEMIDVHDDAIENDIMASGVVDGCLFDGVHAFMSCLYGSGNVPPDGGSNTVVVKDSLIRLAPFHESYKPAKYGHDRHGGFFKWSERPEAGVPPQLVLVGCTFAAWSIAPYGGVGPGRLGLPPDTIVDGCTFLATGPLPPDVLALWMSVGADVVTDPVEAQSRWDIEAASWRDERNA